jgi:hypothetical protein
MRIPRRQHAVRHARVLPARGHCFVFSQNSGRKKRRQQTLISFIWSPGNSLPAGTGGSENYTIGQVRELKRRGVPAQVVTVGLGVSDGREDFPGIPFLSLRTWARLVRISVLIVLTPTRQATIGPGALPLADLSLPEGKAAVKR